MNPRQKIFIKSYYKLVTLTLTACMLLQCRTNDNDIDIDLLSVLYSSLCLLDGLIDLI